jgi:DNA polymerase III subunit alpha
MDPAAFCQLHNHTEYSLLDGAARISDLIDRAVELDMPALAITDHGAMYGVIEFYQACLERGIKPIIGCELYLAPGSRLQHSGGHEELSHLVLLAENETGYQNLIKVVTDTHLNGFYYKPRADFELLAQYSEGLIATTACIQGEIPRRILQEDETSARQYLGQLQEIYGPANVYLEMQQHGIPEQQRVNEAIVRIARDNNTPVIATNDTHYVNRQDARMHDVLLCIQTDSTMQQPKLRFPNDEFYLKSADEMAAVFPENPEALSNTIEIMERCNLEFELGQLNMPRLDVPEGYTREEYLRRLCEDNIETRYGGRPAEVLERLDYELEVIAKSEYTGYFLIVSDFVKEARSRDILVGPGRGSATGSIVAYLLGITDIDPLKYNLIFERMLNPERVTPPDIDLDFPDDRREDIINYVKDKYGDDHVAQVITFSRMGPKASIRDVSRALEIPLDKVNELCKLVPGGPKATIQDGLDGVAELAALVSGDPQVKEIIDYAQGIEGLVRHVSVHAAAVVIASRPITEVVPLCGGGNKGAVTTQYPMDDVEACGLVKIDFLGLKTLTIVDNALRNAAANGNAPASVHEIPLDDARTYALLRSANTAAVFQLESDGMQALLKQLQPDRFEHVIALVALYRPGPMAHAPEFCAGRHGAKIRYLDPRLEPILQETYGVIIYQEQVMKIAVELAGFTMPQAEIIMRAMSKKQEDKMAKMKPLFIEGCIKNGVSPEAAQTIYKRMDTFSGYGFNKSHSAAYALVAYWTAYLKANYPAELMAAQLSMVMDNTDEIAKYVMECRRMGLVVQPPSVNLSAAEFSVAAGAVAFGLAAIKNFGRASAEVIVAERAENGPYTGLYDFCRRMPARQISRAALKQLVQAGAFDEFGERNALLAAHETALAAGQKHQQDRSVGQNSLFDALGDEDADGVTETLPDVPPLGDDEKLAMEKEFLGLYVSDHPLIRAQERLARCCSCFIEDLAKFPDEEVLIVGGMVGETKDHITTNGAPMMFFTLEGLDRSVEVTLLPNTYAKYKDTAVKGEIIIVEAKVQRRGRIIADGEEVVDVKLLATRMRSLKGARPLSEQRRKKAEAAIQRQQEVLTAQTEARKVPSVHIQIDLGLMAVDSLRQLQAVLNECPGSRPVVLEFKHNGTCRRVRLGRQYTVTCDQKLAASARGIPAVTAIWD